MIGCAALGILLLAADLFLSKKLVYDTSRWQIPQLLIAMIGSGLIVTPSSCAKQSLPHGRYCRLQLYGFPE
jgi:hypothetical protein